MKLLVIISCLLAVGFATDYYVPQCPPVPGVSHGYHGGIKGSGGLGSFVLFKCKAPYSIVHPDKRYKGKTVCEGMFNKLQWNNVPKCVACENPGAPEYGTISSDSDYFSIGAKVDWRCNKGFKLDGEGWAQCNYVKGRAVWSHPVPKCIQPCPIPMLANGLYKPDNQDFYEGDSATFSCLKPFTLIGNNRAVCKRFKGQLKWFTIPKCIACKNPGSPANGKINDNAKYFAIDAKVDWKCDEGYKLKGFGWSQCIAVKGTAVWSKPVPECIRLVTCPKPPVPRGQTITPIQNQYAVGAKVTYRCLKGRLYGSATIKCLSSGKWSAGPPKCIIHYVPPTEDYYGPPTRKPYFPKRPYGY